jgi:predicted alternative tryptophan synthase beta-subunit
MGRGQYRYDFGDTTMLTPLTKMFTLGAQLRAAWD